MFRMRRIPCLADATTLLRRVEIRRAIVSAYPSGRGSLTTQVFLSLALLFSEADLDMIRLQIGLKFADVDQVEMEY